MIRFAKLKNRLERLDRLRTYWQLVEQIDKFEEQVVRHVVEQVFNFTIVLEIHEIEIFVVFPSSPECFGRSPAH